VPSPPTATFRQWYIANRGKKDEKGK